jgi:hypothetical protein
LPTTRYGTLGKESVEKISPTDILLSTGEVLKALVGDLEYPSGVDGRMAVASMLAAYLSQEEGNRLVHLQEVESYRERVFPWA